jgi:hypothetical protein
MDDLPVETVRYKLKKEFRRLGFRVHAEVDYSRLGLSLHAADLRFDPAYVPQAGKLLAGLHKIGYLIYYGKLLPRGQYFAVLGLAEGSAGDYFGFLEHLKDKKILQDFMLGTVLAHNHASINPTFFDFRSGKWEVDWNEIRLQSPTLPKSHGQENAVLFDLPDLLLVKELQIDSFQHVVNIARKTKIHPKTLGYHYRSHLLPSGIISGFTIRWVNDVGTTLAHSAMLTRLTVQNYESKNLSKIRLAVNKVPFLWSEYVFQNARYIGFLWIPVEEAVHTFDYLNSEISGLCEDMDLEFVRIGDASLFTIPYHMYKRKWTFDVQKLKSDFEKLTVSTKKEEVGASA